MRDSRDVLPPLNDGRSDVGWWDKRIRRAGKSGRRGSSIHGETHEDGSIARRHDYMTADTIRGLKSPLSAWGLSGPDPFGDGEGSRFKRILLAVTGSKSSRRATELVAALGRDQGSRVFVLHFYERVLMGRGAYIDIESPEDAERLVNRVCCDLERRGVIAEHWTERSYPWITGRLIALAATACCADIIVIGGSRGKSPLWTVLRGGVSHEILHRTTVPVLVVP